MVGNLYDSPEYSSKRDTAFSLFYMAINVGALFAPTAATKMTNYVLSGAGFTYNAQIPSLAHQFLNGTIKPEGSAALEALKAAQGFTGEMASFCSTYIEKLSEAYNYGFAVACISLIASMAIYLGCRSMYKHADYNSKQAKTSNNHNEPELTPEQTKQRIVALLLVFAVVIFFWMRSEEHTSELQSRQYLVCRLLLEKKKHSDIRRTPVRHSPTYLISIFPSYCTYYPSPMRYSPINLMPITVF